MVLHYFLILKKSLPTGWKICFDSFASTCQYVVGLKLKLRLKMVKIRTLKPIFGQWKEILSQGMKHLLLPVLRQLYNSGFKL